MQTKKFTDMVAAREFGLALFNNGFVVDAMTNADQTISVNWIMPKKFINVMDNVEYTDEVWIKEDGTMINCQDLDLEHARNIIRMIMRNDRLRKEEMAKALNQIEHILNGSLDEEVDSATMMPENTDRVLH